MKNVKLLPFLLCAMLLFVQLPAYSEGEPSAKVPVLLYHHIMDGYNPGDKLTIISPAQLEVHLNALKDAGYHSITLDDYYQYMTNGVALPDKPILITFDDGYESNYQYAYPLLQRLGMKATIFIVTGSVGRSANVIPHFTWEQAREMQNSGVIDIESHTNSHVAVDSLPTAKMLQELRYSKYLIEANLGKTCDKLAYPYGFHNDQTIEAAKKAGYTMQFLVENSGCNTKYSDITRLRRLTTPGDLTAEELIAMIEENLEK